MRKYLVFIPGGLAACLGIAMAALSVKQPAHRPAPAITLERTQERIERGRYLYEQVAHCAGCHNERDWDKFSAPTQPGRTGAGFAFPEELGLPGKVVAPNLTSDRETGLGKWSDGEIVRAIREGVSRDGRALFPFMPYSQYRSMSDEDVFSIVAYVRTLPAVRKQQPATELNFPVSLLVKFEPKPVDGKVNPPPKSDRRAYGEYLVKMGNCIECHSQAEKGEIAGGKEFAGGREFPINGFVVRSANITPDEETGIGKWSEDRFVAKFKGYANMNQGNAPKHTQANFTLMPWIEMASMPEEDLRAIYMYLRTVKPVYNSVEVHPPLSLAQTQ
ncbi:MAG: cytochrome c [Bryobacteraceae bacterium]|nr:cytochrome c [Bryobacteraceae bacterium]